MHAEAFRPESKKLSLRYSRHYYDLAMMAAEPSVKAGAFGNLDLLLTVAEFKAKFYPASWASYELAKPGSFKLMPAENNRSFLAHDYEQMHYTQVRTCMETMLSSRYATRREMTFSTGA